MTIFEEYQESLRKEKERYNVAIDKIEEELEIKQQVCKHKWGDREESMFYALGQTYPGKKCLECGQRMRVK